MYHARMAVWCVRCGVMTNKKSNKVEWPERGGERNRCTATPWRQLEWEEWPAYKTAPSAEATWIQLILILGIGATPSMGSDKGVSNVRHRESTPLPHVTESENKECHFRPSLLHFPCAHHSTLTLTLMPSPNHKLINTGGTYGHGNIIVCKSPRYISEGSFCLGHMPWWQPMRDVWGDVIFPFFYSGQGETVLQSTH